MSHYDAVLAIAESIEDLALQSKAWNNLGSIHLTLERFSTAVDCFEKVAMLREQLGDRPGEAKARFILGKTFKEHGQIEEALTAFQHTRQLFEQMDRPDLVEKCDAVIVSLSR